jgi:hypothetical protein
MRMPLLCKSPDPSNFTCSGLHLTKSSTPFMLDSYGHEWEELCRVANAHATEMDTLRNQNRVLSAQVYVKQLSYQSA